MAALKGAPLQAKPEQNHDAHIITHGTFMQNPSSYESPPVQQLLDFSYARSLSYEVSTTNGSDDSRSTERNK